MALPRIQGLTPDVVRRSAGSNAVTINGNFLGFLADSVSLNGVEGTVEVRGTTFVTVRFGNSITTGDIVLKTKAGEALPATPGKCRLTVAP